MDRHRVLVHKMRASGETATQELIDRFRSYARHRPKKSTKPSTTVKVTATATVTVTTATATVTTATADPPIQSSIAVDELTAAIASITGDSEREEPNVLDEGEVTATVTDVVTATATVTTATAQPSTSVTVPDEPWI